MQDLMSPLLFSLTMLSVTCEPGQVTSAETGGHCCYLGQVWSNLQARCVGVPTACPAGKRPEADSCVEACPMGQVSTLDTAGRCCWPNQVWSQGRNQCVGSPACPPGLAADGERCTAAPTYQPRPPSYQAPPMYPAPYVPPGAYQPYGPYQTQPLPPSSPEAALEQKLEWLKQERASVNYSGGIAALAVGVPTTILGFFLLGSRSTVGWGITSITVGSILSIIGTVAIPLTAGRARNLNLQIREAEDGLKALRRAHLIPPVETPVTPGLALVLSSPVFHF